MAADSNYSSLRAKRETTWGVAVDTTAAPLKVIRMTGEGLEHKKDTVVSEEIRSDRQISDLVQVGASAGGDISFELSYTAWKEWFEAMLFSNIVTINTGSITASASLSGQTITASTGTPFADVIAGCFVKVSGFSNALNNGAKLVLTKTDTVLTLAAGSLVADQVGATITVTGGHLKNGTTRHSYAIEREVVNASGSKFYQTYVGMVCDKASLSFESKKIVTGKLDFIGKVGAAPDYSLMQQTAVAAAGTLTFTGNAVDGQTFTIGSRVYTYKTALSSGPSVANEVLIGADADESIDNAVAAITGAAGVGTTYSTGTVAHAQGTAVNGSGDTLVFTASTGGPDGNDIVTTETLANATWGSATLTGGTIDAVTPADTDPVMNATSNVSQIRKNGVTMGDRFKKLDLTIANNVRGLDAIGELGNFDTGTGEFGLTGTLSGYFGDNSNVQDFISHTYVGISYLMTTSEGKNIGINIPKLNFSTGGTKATGKNTDLMNEQAWTAILDPVTGATLLMSFLD